MPNQNDTITTGLDESVQRVLDLYPRIYFAFHTVHVRDPTGGRVVSAKQVSILDHLDLVEPTTLGDLARHLGVTPGTMSVAVERLVRSGYIERQRDPVDGRKLGLRLTPAGARIRDEMTVLDRERVKAGVAGLDPTERAAVVNGLALLADAGERLVGTLGAPVRDE